MDTFHATFNNRLLGPLSSSRKQRRATDDQDVKPAPYVVPPTEEFDGADGLWSTFLLSVGTPGQPFRVLPSTALGETWVVSEAGCTTQDNQETDGDCPDIRGVNAFAGRSGDGFDSDDSSSWRLKGLYSLDLEESLGLDGNGTFGFDTVTLGGGSGSEDIATLTVNSSIAAAIADKDYLLGVFGVGARGSSFSSTSANETLSFLTKARLQKSIPSLSYAYTAGAAYRENGVYGNLVLGGYDSSRFESSGVSFDLGPSSAAPLRLGVQSIIVNSTLDGETLSLTESASGPFTANIDSTVSQLWLPNKTCDAFAAAFGLNYDEATDLYRVNSSTRAKLLEINPSFTFALSDTQYDTGNAINIVLPYAAFDLQATWPIYQEASYYFPIRRSRSSSDYTLGRTLLQEAYIIVDYERENFTVNQAVFKTDTGDSSAQRIVAISSYADSQSGSSGGSSSLSGGAIAGIVIGALAAFAAIGLIVWYFAFFRRRRNNRIIAAKAAELDDNQMHHLDPKDGAEVGVGAAAGTTAGNGRAGRLPSEMEARSPMPEMESPASTLLKPPNGSSSVSGSGSGSGHDSVNGTAGTSPSEPRSPYSLGFSGGTMSPVVESGSEGVPTGYGQRYELEGGVVRHEMEGDNERKRWSFEEGGKG